MAHISPDSMPLTIHTIAAETASDVATGAWDFADVLFVRLPDGDEDAVHGSAVEALANAAAHLSPTATLLIAGNVGDLVAVQEKVNAQAMRFHLWIAVKRTTPVVSPDDTRLPQSHFGVLVYTRYEGSLSHALTRQLYTYCPSCDRTTKDYGGKKHTYNESGTLLSDVWRDVRGDLNGDMSAVIERFADLFGVAPYRELRVMDCRNLGEVALPALPMFALTPETNPLPTAFRNAIITGDCLENLRRLPDNSVDFVFVDPPYNLKKQYAGYGDGLAIQDYFAWCDEWLGECARVLKPGCTLAVLNLPLWTIRHFLFLKVVLSYQNWIVWDALAFPVRRIMPAHYAILCFTKGEPRLLPFAETTDCKIPADAPRTFHPLRPLADGYCLRAPCVTNRGRLRTDDRSDLSDIWSDIHRLKHNSRRVDHPCQLPPHLMYRLLTLFTKPGEVVLDCFNGSGTTTLAAHQLGRDYIGMDSSSEYCRLAEQRHEEIRRGINPFRKEERVLSSKNSPVQRVQKQRYEVSKKALQLEVRRVAQDLGRLPTREEITAHGTFPISYYDSYFSSWGEVCAAARHSGMSENRVSQEEKTQTQSAQLRLFERTGKYRDKV